jgi:hypothetical protein
VKIKDSKTALGPAGAHPSIIHAIDVVDRVWWRVTGRQMRVTGLAEEGHSEASLHYGVQGDPRCRAFDVGAGDTTPEERAKITSELLSRLGDFEYDFVWEGLGTQNAHLHIEFDPK